MHESSYEDDWFEILDKIEQDGYIVIDTRTLEQHEPSIASPHGWTEVMQTQKFSYNETRRFAIDDAGIRVDLRPDTSGADENLFWPWSSIIHYTHRSNSVEVTNRLKEAYDEYQKVKYAEDGIKRMEQVINGEEGPHGPGCSCPPEAELDQAYPINVEAPNPCNPTHHVAVMTHADIWVCLECAARWNSSGDLIENN